MPVLGAVLTLSPQPELAAQARALLAGEPRIELGEPTRDRLPVVLSTHTRDEDRAVWRLLETWPGITHVELAFADFSDLQNEDTLS